MRAAVRAIRRHGLIAVGGGDDPLGFVEVRRRVARPQRCGAMTASVTAVAVEPEQLPELLAPLLGECQRLGLPGVTDPLRLAEAIKPYSSAQVAAAAQRMTADLAGGAPMRSPVAPHCAPPRRDRRRPSPNCTQVRRDPIRALLDEAAALGLPDPDDRTTSRYVLADDESAVALGEGRPGLRSPAGISHRPTSTCCSWPQTRRAGAGPATAPSSSGSASPQRW
ncbi:MAG: hypothetical protein ACRD1K_16565 [Acidimicrobiales bacterium]